MRTTPVRGWHRAFFDYPLLLIAGVVLAGLLLVGMGIVFVDEREERSFAAYSERLMQTFVEQQAHELERILRDYAIWDEMAAQVRGERVDLQWLEKNLTKSIYTNLKVNDALVLSASFKPLYYLQRGEPAALAKLSDWNPAVAEHLQKSISLRPGVHYLSGIVKAQGGVQFLVAERIRPEYLTGGHDYQSGWMLFTRNLDPSWLEDTSRLLSVKEIGVEDTPPQAGVPRYALLAPDRQQVTGWLSWRVNREQAGEGPLRPLLFGLLLLFLFVVLLARSILKMHARQIETQARMLQHSETLRRLSRLAHGVDEESRQLQDIAEAVKRNLNATQVVIWRNTNRGVYRCVAASGCAVRADRLLEQGEYADYFRQLAERRALVLDQIEQAPVPASLRCYWQSLGVSAILDVAIMIRGRFVGVLSVEVTGEPRLWEQDQIGFVTAAADLLALAHESAERRRTELALHRQQFYDTLTGLPNQNRLGQLVQQRLLLPGCRMVFALWNIGGLLHVNEELGRSGGDLVLQEIAQRLEQTTGEHIAARLAGNRFVIVLLDVPAPLVSQDVEHVYYRLLEPIDLNGRQVVPQLSCGVSLSPQDAFTFEELLRHAEFALEVARSCNGIPIEFYAPEPNGVARERYQLAGALPAALIRGEFELYFQPFVDLASRNLLGFEALLRWHHPEKGLIPPAQFIQIADETGQIHALGRFILEEACQRLRHWQDLTGKPLTVAINISSMQLHDPDFIVFIRHVLAENRIDPACLEFEITEKQSIDVFERYADAMQRLRELGIRLAIDDFGSGYASLSYLCHIPANKLKIDSSFIEKIPEDSQDADLARMIISLGRIQGMTVVAEGIETEAQLEFLREQGCHIGQGNLLGRPASAQSTTMLLVRGLHRG